MTYTLNTNFGSGIVAKRGHRHLAEQRDGRLSAKPGVANAWRPGRRRRQRRGRQEAPLVFPMTPTLVLKGRQAHPGDRQAPGGARIITTVLQTVVNTIDFGNNLPKPPQPPRAPPVDA